VALLAAALWGGLITFAPALRCLCPPRAYTSAPAATAAGAVPRVDVLCVLHPSHYTLASAVAAVEVLLRLPLPLLLGGQLLSATALMLVTLVARALPLLPQGGGELLRAALLFCVPCTAGVRDIMHLLSLPQLNEGEGEGGAEGGSKDGRSEVLTGPTARQLLLCGCMLLLSAQALLSHANPRLQRWRESLRDQWYCTGKQLQDAQRRT
jgi:hypothetical protein